MLPHHTPAALQQFTKNRKVRSFTSCKSIRYCHAPQIPIWAILPYHQSDPTFAKTCAGFGRSTEHPWRIVTPAGPIPAETSGRLHSNLRVRPTHSNSLRRRGGHGRQGTASLRDATTATTGEPAPACVIGPKGPIIVEPLGSTAVRPVSRTDSPPEGGHVWHAWGVLMRSDGGPLDGGPLRVWLYSLLKRPANKRVL